jgi:transcriptional regulator with XRE-family HTH domain
MANPSAKEPEPSGQLPLAELVAERRRALGLSLAAVARLMHKAAEKDGDYCLANRQAIHDYERGRIPYHDSLRWLASSLEVSFDEVRAAAERQRAHRELLRAAGSIWGEAADTRRPADPLTEGVGNPGPNRGTAGAAPPTSMVDTFPHVGYPLLGGSSGATSTARPTWGTRYEQRVLLETELRRPGDNEDMNRRQLLVDLAVLGLAAPLAGAEVVRQGLTAAVAGDRHAADIDEWDRIVDEYARSYYVTPTDRLLRDLTADLSVMQSRLGGTEGTLQRSLARAGGQLAAISAVAWADAAPVGRRLRRSRGPDLGPRLGGFERSVRAAARPGHPRPGRGGLHDRRAPRLCR